MAIETPIIPAFSELGPDERVLHDALRAVAEHEAGEAPILSVYLDARPTAHGERPGDRPQLIEVRDRLDQIIDEQPAHTAARASLEADRERIRGQLETDDARHAAGIGIFASDDLGLWQATGTAEPFETDVAAGPIGDLYQFARMADGSQAALLAIADSNTCRLFVWRRGALVELPPIDEGTEEHKRHDQGGWSQARFQRHIDEQDRRFLSRVANAIDTLVEYERANVLLIAADERTQGTLLDALPDRSRALLTDVRRIQMHAGLEEIRGEIAPLINAVAQARSIEVADRAAAGHEAGDLGVLGTAEVGRMLERGAVAEFVIDDARTSQMDRWRRAALVRQAILTDARVVVVRDHATLAARDGVGATLRFRP